ncbi:MAG TPA: MT-A70 family methyltransferase [Xanthobacteraceae bacterium]
MKQRGKKTAKKTGKGKPHKSLGKAMRALKRKAKAKVKPKSKIKLGAATPAAPDAMVKRIERLETPKGFAPRPADTRWLKEIKIGKRHRKEFGDLKGLALSFDDRGALLQPVVITPDDRLIAGERRMKAWPLSKFKDQPIPVRAVTIDSILAGEWDENAKHKPFNPTESAALADEIEKQLKVLARERQRSGKQAAPALKGNAADQAARVAGLDRKTISKARAVAKAAKEDPERFGKLQRDMDKSGKVNGPFKRLQVMQQTDALRKAPAPLPMRGPYGVVVIDYPHPSEKDAEQTDIDARGRSMRDYPEMAIAEGCKLFSSPEFQALLAPDCTIYFWTTNHHMFCAERLLKAMGFEFNLDGEPMAEHSTIGTWVKNKMGRGQVLRGKTEHCVIATRGKPVINLTNQTTAWQGKGWEVTGDSRKPDAFFAMVEELTPAARYAEIFSRGGRGPLWDCHGDQVGKFAAADARAAEASGLAEAGQKPKRKKKTPLEAAIDAAAERGATPVRRTLHGRDTIVPRAGEAGSGCAALIAFAEACGHVVSMTIDHDSNESVGSCQCGWSHREPRHGTAGDASDPAIVEQRMAAVRIMDAAITEHWRAQFEGQTTEQKTEFAHWQLLTAVQAGREIRSDESNELELLELIKRKRASKGFQLTKNGEIELHAIDQRLAALRAGDQGRVLHDRIFDEMPVAAATSAVTPGLDPGVHETVPEKQEVDGRDKPGHDEAVLLPAGSADPDQLAIPGFLRRAVEPAVGHTASLVNPKHLPTAAKVALIADRAAARADKQGA